MTEHRIRVAVNAYGVIGKRVADAVRAVPDMVLVGVIDETEPFRQRVRRADVDRDDRTGTAAAPQKETT